MKNWLLMLDIKIKDKILLCEYIAIICWNVLKNKNSISFEGFVFIYFFNSVDNACRLKKDLESLKPKEKIK